jgi:uncharacterized protein YjbI with pentapeptide repeats
MKSLRRKRTPFTLHLAPSKGFRAPLLFWILLLCIPPAPTPAAQTAPNAVAPDVTGYILSSLKSGQVADAQGAALDPDFVLSLVLRPDHDLPYGVRLRRAHFTSRLDLSSAQISSSLWLVDCLFDDGADFTGTRIAGDLSLEQSQFRYPAKMQDTNNIFIGLKVLGDTTLTAATFYGPVDFTNSEFRGEFTADNARFLAPDTSADFQYAQFRGTAFFRQSSFTGTLKMWFAQIQDLTLAFDPSAVIHRIEMPQVVVQRSLTIQGGQLEYLGLASLRVLGAANLGPLCVARQLDLHKASFDTVSLNIAPCPSQPGNFLVYVSGLRYFFITSDDGGPPTDSLLLLLAASNFKGISSDPNTPPDPGLFAQYAQFEAFLRAHNYADDADRVLVAGKRRERATSFQGITSGSWWKSLFLDLTVGYGTEPLRPLVFCLVVVIIGTIVLDRPDQMGFTDDKRGPQKYSAFWYSLDKFAPVIDLKVADVWEPKTPGLQRFALGLRILGFVLVPLALASVSGMFK